VNSAVASIPAAVAVHDVPVVFTAAANPYSFRCSAVPVHVVPAVACLPVATDIPAFSSIHAVGGVFAVAWVLLMLKSC
jgi:hypothetical protein